MSGARQVCFPEPPVPDPTKGRRRESTPHFLARSTWGRAQGMRRALNANLAAIDEPTRGELCQRLHTDRTQATWFELLTGRFLQVRGASSLEAHPGTGARRVDWLGTFPDGTLSLEATVPVFDAYLGERVRPHARMLDALEGLVPDGWTALPFSLPAISENAPLAPFRAAVRELFASLPDSATVPQRSTVELVRNMPEGQLEIHMYARQMRTRVGLEPGPGVYFSNAEEKIADAWLNRRKREQGRAAAQPAVLAVMADPLAADLENFEVGLFGRGPGDGVMAVDTRPPWAGVIAFTDLGWRHGAEPVFLASPHWSGPLPAALARLQARRLVDGRIETTPALDHDVLAGVAFVTPAEADTDPID